jgi:2,3-bisphosphoglycerate-independent phosphoglycerate mutase
MQSITEGTFASNPTLQAAFANATTRSHSRLHLLGLVSDGGVHSHINHVFEFLKAAKAAGIKDTYVHFFADGRGRNRSLWA